MKRFNPRPASPAGVPPRFQTFTVDGPVFRRKIRLAVMWRQRTRVTRTPQSLACSQSPHIDARDLNPTRAPFIRIHPQLNFSIHHKIPITYHIRVPRERLDLLTRALPLNLRSCLQSRVVEAPWATNVSCPMSILTYILYTHHRLHFLASWVHPYQKICTT